jgi:hypothetical protein
MKLPKDIIKFNTNSKKRIGEVFFARGRGMLIFMGLRYKPVGGD